MKIFNSRDVSDVLSHWEYADKCIFREVVFKDFKEAFSFMVQVAFHAEILDHHPEWTNVYNKVLIKLSTHSEGEVTDKDIELAGRIDKILSV